MDVEGIIPDSLESVCRTERISALVCMPSHQSPTLAVMSLDRRKRIAEIAARYEFSVIENDVYGHLAEHNLPTLSSFQPNHCFYVTSLFMVTYFVQSFSQSIKCPTIIRILL